MKLLRLLLTAFGIALVLSGGLWTLQGLGIVMWPAESFMLAERAWALYGSITVLIGIALILMGRRIRP
ncbi:MAG: hypothetical protein R3E21_08505 [Caenibius sp.]